MRWPAAPTCHEPDDAPETRGYWCPPIVRRGGQTGLDDQGRERIQPHVDRPFRTCDHCGAINAEDLHALARHHALRLSAAEGNHDFPYKIYVEGIPTSFPGERIVIGAHSHKVDGRSVVEPIYGVVQGVWAKFYTEHLCDEGYDGEALDSLIELLWRGTSVEFRVNDRGLHFARRPYEARTPPPNAFLELHAVKTTP